MAGEGASPSLRDLPLKKRGKDEVEGDQRNCAATRSGCSATLWRGHTGDQTRYRTRCRMVTCGDSSVCRATMKNGGSFVDGMYCLRGGALLPAFVTLEERPGRLDDHDGDASLILPETRPRDEGLRELARRSILHRPECAEG
jgi:hypothetical protein